MRDLTLHEKITFKGILSPRLHYGALPKLDMRSAQHYWHMLFGYLPIADYYKVTPWHITIAVRKRRVGNGGRWRIRWSGTYDHQGAQRVNKTL